MSLEIAVETVCEIIVHLRAYDSGIPAEDEEFKEDEADDVIEEGELEERMAQPHADPVYDELATVIDGLNIEEQTHLVALLWLGRGDFSPDEWDDAVATAQERHSEHTAEYLTGVPIAADHLESGLEALGYSCED